MSTRLNGDLWEVRFKDALDALTAPSSQVKWEVVRNRRWLDTAGDIITPDYDDNGKVDPDSVVHATQEIAANEGTGIYQLTYTPKKAGPYSVKGYAIVGGVMQAVPATEVEVER